MGMVMRILFIALQQEAESTRRPDGAPAGTDPARLARLEAGQALAMAGSLRDGGRFAPLLVCRKGGRLHAEAQALGLPALAVGGGGDVTAHARLWLWQRRHKALLIQTVGAEAVGLGRRVLGMRKKGSALLSHAFFVRPPAPECCRSRAMRAAARVFCGSEHVRRRIREIWEGMPEKRRPAAVLDMLAPGVALADYRLERGRAPFCLRHGREPGATFRRSAHGAGYGRALAAGRPAPLGGADVRRRAAL